MQQLIDDCLIIGDVKRLKQEQKKPRKKTVRVFISSTFTDWSTERNALMKADGVFPTLQEYFKEKYSLDFEALLGDKYGFCPLVSAIPQKHFKHITACLRSAGDEQAAKLVEKWYRLDLNGNQRDYVLCSPQDNYPHINSKELAHEDERAEENKKWSQEQEKLTGILHKAADLLRANAEMKMTDAEYQRYVASVTEMEVLRGMKVLMAQKRVLCFIREFFHSQDSVEDCAAKPRFFDVARDGKLDEKKHGKAVQLRENAAAGLPPENTSRWQITFDAEVGVNPSNSDHKAYLIKFCDEIRDRIIKCSEALIAATDSDQNKVKNDDDKNIDDDDDGSSLVLPPELQHHTGVCLKTNENYVQLSELELKLDKFLLQRGPSKAEIQPQAFYDEIKAMLQKNFVLKDKQPKADVQEQPQALDKSHDQAETRSVRTAKNLISKLVAQAQQRLSTVDNGNVSTAASVRFRSPFIIYGESGSGKTSLVANLVLNFDSWFGSTKASLKIFRFLGTSPYSSELAIAFWTTISQLSAAFGYESDLIGEVNVRDLSESLWSLLWILAPAFDGNILLVFDSINQLSDTDRDTFAMNWLPERLPENVFLVVTIMPTFRRLLDNAKRRLTNGAAYFEMPPLTEDVFGDFFSTFFGPNGRGEGRSLTEPQRNIIFNRFSHCRSPMFLKLAFEQAKQWRSFTKPKDFNALGSDCLEVIGQLFKSIELKFGQAATAALQYITLAREGLTDAEIEDLLSLDDEVLQDTYVFHTPPEADLVRFPTIIWRRIRQDINEWIVELDGRMMWYHWQFSEAAETLLKGHKKRVHAEMAAYFSDEWVDKKKPLWLQRHKSRAEYKIAKRIITSSVERCRRLTELPYHLIQSDKAEAAAKLLCDFEFLMGTLKEMDLGVGMKHLLGEMELYFSHFAPKDYPVKSCNLAYVKLVLASNSAEQPRLEPARYSTNQDVLSNVNVAKHCPLNEHGLQVKIVYELLALVNDSCRNATSEFAAQVIARLSPLWFRFGLIERLVKQARDWIRKEPDSLLVPQLQCIEGPGNLLLTTIKHIFWLPEDGDEIPAEMTSHFAVSKHKICYVLDRSREPDEGDVVREYDLSKTIDLLKTHTFARFSPIKVISVNFIGDEKHLLIRRWKHRAVVKNLDTGHVRYAFAAQNDLDVRFTGVSKSGKLVLHVYDKPEAPSFSVFRLGSDSDLERELGEEHSCESVDCAALPTESAGPVSIVAAAVSPNDSLVTLVTSVGALYVYALDKSGKGLHQRLQPPTEDDRCSAEDLRHGQLEITGKNQLISRGLSSSTINDMYVYDLLSQAEICAPHSCVVEFFALNKSERWVASAAKYRTQTDALPLQVWEVDTGKTIVRISGSRGFSSLAFCGRDDEYLAFARQIQQGISIVKVGTPARPERGCVLLQIDDTEDNCFCLLSTVGAKGAQQLISFSTDQLIKLWDMDTATHMWELVRESSIREAEEKSSHRENDSSVEVVYEEQPIGHVEFRGNLSENIKRTMSTKCSVSVLALSKCNKLAVGGCASGRALFLDLVYGTLVIAKSHTTEISSVQFSDSGTNVYTYSVGDKFLNVWNFSGALVKRLDLGQTLYTIKIKDNRVYAGHPSGTLSIFDTATGNKLETYTDDKCTFESFVFCEGNKIGTVSDERFLILLDGSKVVGEPISVAPPAEAGYLIDYVEASANGRFVAAALRKPNEYKCAVSFVSVADWAPMLHVVPWESGILTSLTFVQPTPTSAFALLGTYHYLFVVDLNARKWEPFSIHDEHVAGIALGHNGRYVATVSDDTHLKLWHLDFEKMRLDPLAHVTFHCTLDQVVIAEDLSFILVPPRAAAPFAVFTLNDHLKELVKKLTPDANAIPQVFAKLKSNSASSVPLNWRGMSAAAAIPRAISFGTLREEFLRDCGRIRSS